MLPSSRPAPLPPYGWRGRRRPPNIPRALRSQWATGASVRCLAAEEHWKGGDTGRTGHRQRGREGEGGRRTVTETGHGVWRRAGIPPAEAVICAPPRRPGSQVTSAGTWMEGCLPLIYGWAVGNAARRTDAGNGEKERHRDLRLIAAAQTNFPQNMSGRQQSEQFPLILETSE